ncbi:hypothetical protein MtrunA17_Chr2g0315811 [Medicago truncatula]|uniref:Uncharacterized protein n=1 Tax=Medicago truncatula TaxID=3880 RepID=A0A396JET6_MEDTR|nr:hypothetical protein MtrunA17_Chr2g0315811 [Medicago truncatula]
MNIVVRIVHVCLVRDVNRYRQFPLDMVLMDTSNFDLQIRKRLEGGERSTLNNFDVAVNLKMKLSGMKTDCLLDLRCMLTDVGMQRENERN